MFAKQASSVAIFLQQHAGEQVFRTDVLMSKAVGFFGRVMQDAPTLVAERKVNGCLLYTSRCV